MSNSHCDCSINSDLPGILHAPSCPLFRHYARPVTHEERQHAAAYGDREADPVDIVGKPAGPSPVLPAHPLARKNLSLATGLLDYFPNALLAVAALSRIGNEQHNPGQPMHWNRGKSGDEADALLRHLVDRGLYDTDGVRHSAKVAWRALALLQKELEENEGAPLSRGSL